MRSGFTGISFPFRISNTGGVEMSSTSADDISHISEAIQQIILTHQGERKMEYDFNSAINEYVFDPNDVGLQSILAFQIKKALTNLEDRIEVVSVRVVSEDNIAYVILQYKVLIYDTVYTEKIKVGGLE